jgi:hypothetical protein
MLLGVALVNIYCEATTDFITVLGGDPAELAALTRRFTGPVAWSAWMMLTAALLPPLLFLLPALRGRPAILAWVGAAAAAGIWCDHYTLIVSTLQHDYLPAAAGGTHITFFEWSTFAGSAGLFLLLLLVFLRLLPIVSLVESRILSPAHAPGARVRTEHPPAHGAPLWGVAAEFSNAADLAGAMRHLRNPGFPSVRLDSYSPVPAPDAAAALGLGHGRLPAVAAAGGLAGAAAMFAMCTYATGYDYVFNIGGRPNFSWPAFLVPTASFACLCAGTAAVGAMLMLNRLPRLNHPAFNINGIRRATQDRFFAVAHWTQDDLDPSPLERVLADLPDAPLAISRVPR